MTYTRIYLTLVLLLSTIISQAQQHYNCRLLEKISETVSWEKEKSKMISLLPDIVRVIDVETGEEFFVSRTGRQQQQVDSLAIALDSLNYSLDSAVIFGAYITIIDTFNFFDSSCNVNLADVKIKIVNSINGLDHTLKSPVWYLYSVGTNNNNLVLTFSFKERKEFVNFNFSLKMSLISLIDTKWYWPP